jgi:hypothetical protein
VIRGPVAAGTAAFTCRLDHDARSPAAPDSGEDGDPPTPPRGRRHTGGVYVPAKVTEVIEWQSRRRWRLAVELRASRWYAVEVPNNATKLTT